MLTINLKSETVKESKYFNKDIIRSMQGGQAIMYVGGKSFACNIVSQYYFKTNLIAN